jgi:hypothetical protein
MPSVVRIEGKVSVSLAEPNKHTSQLDGANMVVMEQRWVVLTNEKLRVYDKKLNLSRKVLTYFKHILEHYAHTHTHAHTHRTRTARTLHTPMHLYIMHIITHSFE